jgi:putative Ca2+/H+ antiporter (TMEM165/GDT1 family)
VVGLRVFPALLRLAERLDRAWVPAAAWSALFVAHLLAGRLGLPTVKLWAP